jgi:hypothetical protein
MPLTARETEEDVKLHRPERQQGLDAFAILGHICATHICTAHANPDGRFSAVTPPLGSLQRSRMG